MTQHILRVGVVTGLLLACWGVAGADDLPSTCPAISAVAVSDDNLAALARGNQEFGLRLYGQLAEKKGNLFFSPYSISTAMSMVYLGAAGQTADEMAAGLCIPSRPDAAGVAKPWSMQDLADAYKN